MIYPQAGSVAVGVGVIGVEVCVGVVGSGVDVAVGDGVIVGVGVIVGEGVIVGVFVAVGVSVAVDVLVGVGNTRGIAGRLMLHAASLNWIEKPKFEAPRLAGGSMNEPENSPPQSMVRLLLGFAARFMPNEVGDVASSPEVTTAPFHVAQLRNSPHPYRLEAVSKGPQFTVTPVTRNPG